MLPLWVTAERWAQRWRIVAAAPDQYLPSWAALRASELGDRVSLLAGCLPTTTLCHFDVRDDNLLLNRETKKVVILDWGMARLGPWWTDQVLLALQAPTAGQTDRWLREWLPAGIQDLVTTFLLGFGGSQAWNAQQPAPPSLPSMPAFCLSDAKRVLALAERRTA